MIGFRSFSTRRQLEPILWIAAALVIGVLVGTQQPSAAVVVIGGVVLLICAAVTPLAPLIALLIIAPIRTLFATESPVQIPLDLGQWLLIFTFAGWFAHRSLVQQRLPRFTPSLIFGSVAVFAAAAALSAFSAYSFSTWLTEFLKWAQILVLIVLIIDVAERRAWEWIIFGLVAAALVNAVLGIFQFFGGSGADHLLINDANFRAFGTFGQPNPFGGFMGLIAPISAAAALGYTQRAWNFYRTRAVLPYRMLSAALFYAVSTAILAAALLMSWGRGAWLAFGISMLVLVATAPRKLWHGIALVTAGFALVVLAWASGRLPASIVERINSATQETFSFTDVRGADINPANYALYERLAHWQAAINMATAHPYLGVGLGNYEIAYPDFRLMYWKYPLGHAHNYYLNVFAETGIIGFVCYLVMWAGIITATWNVSRRQPDPLARLVAAGFLGTWSYLAVHSLTDNLYVNNLFIHLGVILGITAALSPQRSYQRIGTKLLWGKSTQSS